MLEILEDRLMFNEAVKCLSRFIGIMCRLMLNEDEISLAGTGHRHSLLPYF